jgi:hypothetical protein
LGIKQIRAGGVAGYDAEVSFDRRKGLLGVNYRIELSTDLKTWVGGREYWAEGASEDTGDGLTETVRYRIRNPRPELPQVFVRLVVEE